MISEAESWRGLPDGLGFGGFIVRSVPITLPHRAHVHRLATVSPTHVLEQDEVTQAARAVFAGRSREFERLALYGAIFFRLNAAVLTLRLSAEAKALAARRV